MPPVARERAHRRGRGTGYSGAMSDAPDNERFEFPAPGPAPGSPAGPGGSPDAASEDAVERQMRDIAEVPAVEVITTAAVHLMSAAAVKCGLAAGEDAEELKDLDEARKLITALAGYITAAAPEIGSQHAAPLRDGLNLGCPKPGTPATVPRVLAHVANCAPAL